MAGMVARGLGMGVTACLLFLLTLAGCDDGGGEQKAAYRGSDISGATFGDDLRLHDHNGRPVSLTTFRGKLVVLFFGYTHCPDVCPTTLSDMAQAMKLLPADAAQRVQVLFVTVDPERDTPAMLKAYVPYFDPRFLGLYGTRHEVDAVVKSFRVMYRKHYEPGASDYLVDHSAGSYVLDGEGRIRLYLPFAHPPQDIAHDLLTLMRAG